MIPLGFYLLIIIALMALGIEVVVRILIYKGKKINLQTRAYDALRKMLTLRGIDFKSEDIQIIESKRHSYHPLQNMIRIRGFDLKTGFDHTLSLHEGGHYLSLTQNIQKRKRFMFTLSMVAINRIIIIPIFIIAVFVFDDNQSHLLIDPLLLTILLTFFVIASALRLSIGMSEEYNASRIALKHIDQYYEKTVIKYAKRQLLACFYQQLSQALFITIAIPLIYTIIILYG